MDETTTAEPAPNSRVSASQARRAHAAPKGRGRSLVEWIIILVVALVAAFVIRTYIIESYVIPTPSMYPTIKDGDRVLVNKLSFDFGNSVHVGDIVVFHKPPADTDPSTPILIKRVIGLPGETLRSGPNGEIFIDNKLLDQPWLTHAAKVSPGPVICSSNNTTDCQGRVLHLPAGEYYMMGDNRGDSDDSRFWGPVPRHLLIGRAFVRIWPLDRIHWF